MGKSPFSRQLHASLVLLWTLWASSALATTRYVSTTGSDATSCANSATITTPKRNLGGASGAIACVQSGDTLLIRAGTYAERIILTTTQHNGTAGFPTTFAAYPGETVIIMPGGNEPIVPTVGAALAYITFDGLILDGTGTGNETGWNIDYGAHHITWQNGEIRNWHYNGVYIAGTAHDNLIKNSYIHHQISTSGAAPERWYGVYVAGYNNRVEGNNIEDNPGGGMQIYPSTAQDNVIVGNRVHNNNNANVTDSFIGGMLLAGSRNIAYNNLFYSNGGVNAAQAHGTRMKGGSDACTDCVMYNNTFWGNKHYGLEIESGASGSIVKNNIFYNNTSGSILNAGTASVFGTNLCQAAGTGCAFTGNPNFVSTGTEDFRLQASSTAALDVGVSLSGTFTTDFLSVVRPQGSAWDVGAYEYVPVAECP